MKGGMDWSGSFSRMTSLRTRVGGNGWSYNHHQKNIVSAWCMYAKLLQVCLTLLDPVDCSLPGSPFVGFSRQEYWSQLPCPPPGGLPNSGIEPKSLTSPALAGGLFTISAIWEAHSFGIIHEIKCSMKFICLSVGSSQLNNQLLKIYYFERK